MSEEYDNEVVGPQVCEVHHLKEPCDQCDADAASAAEAFVAARKRPLLDPEEEPALPDVDAYLDEFNLSNLQKIQICRTFANHLSARMRMVKRRL